jgi:2-polyprenyl-3-methyl-5-hydroxy-6-metoxy-1,4-benzoquinol methylase
VSNQSSDLQPGQCRICGSANWRQRYAGPIRHGTFGKFVDGIVYECDICGVGFLPSSIGLHPEFYDGTAYRHLVGEESVAENFFQVHDAEQLSRYGLLEGAPLRGRVIADVGCAGGSFLDGVRGFASATIGIEPSVVYHESLRGRGHHVFASPSDAAREWSGKVDVAVCFSVVEHVPNPVEFLRLIRTLLAPGGRLLISTPNAHDILLVIGSESYRQFFYRSVHAYYFDAASLRTAATAAGFGDVEAFFIHRFNFANFIDWLEHQRPSGNSATTPLGSRFDRIWKAELQESGHADYLYAWLTAE